jgi:hypothetical protein
MRIAHIAVEFGARNERGNRVNDITSTLFERTSVSAISNACSPGIGCEISKSSTFTPSFFR